MWMVSKTEVGNDASSEKDMSRLGSMISSELDTASDTICYHTDLKSDSFCLIRHRRAAKYRRTVSPMLFFFSELPDQFSKK